MPPSLSKSLGLPTSCMPNYAQLCLGALVFLCVVLWHKRNSKASRLPPGPRGSLLFGIREKVLKSKNVWKQYADWARVYGPVVYFKSGQVDFIVLNDLKSIHDLLEKRLRIYSDRPPSVMFGDLVGQDMSFFRISSQHPRFPLYRKLSSDELGSRGMKDHYAGLESCTKLFLQNLLRDPGNLKKHLRLHSGGAILKSAYGYTVQPENDYFIGLIEDYAKLSSTGLNPGMWLVDSYPFLRFLPRGFPGTKFLEFAEQRKAMRMQVMSEPTEWVKKEMEAGRAIPSFVSKQLSASEPLDEEGEDVVRYVANALYLAGADTTVAAMLTFFFIMVLYPDIQSQAQAEIDRIVGNDRLPEIGDKENLPYVNGLLKEILRFHPSAPLGLPHSVTEDDIYEGMLIPKGCNIVPNIWAVMHDPSLYPEPMKFDPFRHIPKTKGGPPPQPDPREIVFGFGRRVCPGMYFAEASLFLSISATLAVFNVEKARDEMGREITPVLEFTGRTVSRPEEFQCSIVPRSSAASDLIQLAC
ncbi:cytochrome P450 [Sistotremastrum niveocremeum HHB9708]|uniref:Cytochrome P450 n=1 Tax=Sistotremastrum niveocremeum HHB9708 TaxID=1314777 RepID=A0A164PG91_9AGAM|nr:cytochrome P450 [Sistotremastrum niveocremeum HHB9708]